ncbi:hypothetical protein BJL95_22375 [Methylomonas sp. LWB]|nr:hypothetical protein BJL95_22375 [Methylomonas sp. LWB]
MLCIGAFAEHTCQTINILLVCGANPLLDGLSCFGVFEYLFPSQVRTFADRNELHGKLEVWRAIMMDHDFGIRYKFLEETVIGIVVPIRAVHDELPATTFSELKNFKGVGKTFRPPP